MQDRESSRFNFEHCQKCAICTTVCPVMANNPRYAGPKQSGPDQERYRLINGLFYDDAIKYCLNCKRCEVACPSGIKIADLVQAAKLQYGHSPGIREKMVASTDLVGSLAVPFSPIVNWGLSLKPAKAMLDKTVGIAKNAPMPRYAKETFTSWFNRHARARQDSFPRHISYFHGCYANYNYPQLGKDFVTVMNALGYGVHLLKGERCCGVAKISNGMEDLAAKDARHNISLMRQSVREGRDIITVSTSCTLTMLEEYPHLLGVDNSDVRGHISLFERFVCEALSDGRAKAVWKQDYKARAAYHCPCHQERLGWGVFTTRLLGMIPGLELTELDSNCCGIAGTYGFKKENYEVSQRIGAPLFRQIKELHPDYVACECETCKWQIEGSTAFPVKNPVSILAEALDLDKTSLENNHKTT